MEYIDGYGSVYEVKAGVLYYAPAFDRVEPEPDMEHYGEVTAVDTVSEEHGKQFLNDINQRFGTDFKLHNFDGR